MRLLPATTVALLISWQASADPLSYSIYSIKGAKPELMAENTVDYTATDIEVQEWGPHQGHKTWKKSLKLKDGFSIGALVVRLEKPQGFGLWVAQDDYPSGFSWEWFEPDDGDVYKKLQGGGYVRVKLAKFEDGLEIQSVEFLTDVKLRFVEDVKMEPGKKTHEVVVNQGSILRFSDGT